MTKDSKMIHERRLVEQDIADQNRQKYQSLTEALSVFKMTNDQMSKANETEKRFIKTKRAEVKELKELLILESKQRDQFLQHTTL